MRHFETRNDFVRSLPPGLRILEVGVFKGEFSSLLLSTNPKRLTLLDLFDGNTQSGDKDGCNMQSANMADQYHVLFNLFIDHPVQLLRGSSVHVLPRIKPRSFDLIYIDGDHKNPTLMLDLYHSIPLLSECGLLCGHDYHEQEYPDVFHEVNRLAASSVMELDFLTQDRLPSFGLRRRLT